jgi:hypothetical protein
MWGGHHAEKVFSVSEGILELDLELMRVRAAENLLPTSCFVCCGADRGPLPLALSLVSAASLLEGINLGLTGPWWGNP